MSRQKLNKKLANKLENKSAGFTLLEVLVALRSRFYDLGLTVNVKFTGKED